MTTNNSTNNDLSFPVIRTGIKDSNGNEILALTATASAVNYFAMQNTSTGLIPTFYVLGSDTNISMYIATKGTGCVNIAGTGTNDSAPAGYVGEIISSNIVAASGVTVSSAATANITSIFLTAGNWDIWGNVLVQGTTVTTIQAGISVTTATLPDPSLTSYIAPLATSATAGVPIPGISVSIAGSTTYYLVINPFGTGTIKCSGNIYARRRR